MDINLLLEKHDFKEGDDVTVYLRNKPSPLYDRLSLRNSPRLYNGKIDKILRIEEDKYSSYKNNVFDHFYIQFPVEIYHELLQRGHNIIYNKQRQIIGNIIRNDKENNIEKIFIQYPFVRDETEIELNNINSMLIWRAGFNIIPKNKI